MRVYKGEYLFYRPPGSKAVEHLDCFSRSLSPPLIKMADCGVAAFAPSLQLETSCGSTRYANPEVVSGEKYVTRPTSIVLHALLSGRLPSDHKNTQTLLSKDKSV